MSALDSIEGSHLRVIEEPPLPPAVERMLEGLVREWARTRQLCIERAIVLEAIAADLRRRAEQLGGGIETLPDEIRGCVQFEVEARRLAVMYATMRAP